MIEEALPFLYQQNESLYLINEQPTPSSNETSQASLSFSDIEAESPKQYLVLIEAQGELKKSMLSLLDNILKSIHLSISKVEWQKVAPGFKLSNQHQNGFQAIFTFTSQPAHEQLSLYEWNNWENMPCLWADSLEQIHQDKAKKMALWKALQDHFLS